MSTSFPIQVMKFGGASVKDAESVRNVGRIIQKHLTPGKGLVVVISAMAKTTNHLEMLAWAARDAKEADTWEKLAAIRKFHAEIIADLFGDRQQIALDQVEGYFAEVERICRGILLLNEFPQRTYDRIVAYGELISTTIVEHYLQQEGIHGAWMDARNIIKTDARYTQAQVIWKLTQENIDAFVHPLLLKTGLLVTQGFIASSIEGKVTTLGREGSDYTAAIFASCLRAESMTVWKDVPGILNGDPRIEPQTVKLDSISYEEAVEMTFYGATVIHPKTMKPLYNGHIPLYVKCFSDLAEKGTAIGPAEEGHSAREVCSRIVKKSQALMQIKPRDFSFMDENLLNRVFQHIARAGVAVSLVQVSAISLTLCVTESPDALKEFESLLLDTFFVTVTLGLKIKTFINFGEAEWAETENALLVQQTENKLFVVLKEG